MTRDEKIEAIHRIMHPYNGRPWIECDKFWCLDFIPAFVDGDLVLPDDAGIGDTDMDYETHTLMQGGIGGSDE